MHSLAEIRKIVRFCQKNGILKYKDGDFEIEIKAAVPLPDKTEQAENKAADFPSWDSLTEEQKLLWSAT